MYWKLRWFIEEFTLLCLWLIKKTNPYKDRVLSQNLFDLAEEYNTRPGTFNYHIGDENDDNA